LEDGSGFEECGVSSGLDVDLRVDLCVDFDLGLGVGGDEAGDGVGVDAGEVDEDGEGGEGGEARIFCGVFLSLNFFGVVFLFSFFVVW